MRYDLLVQIINYNTKKYLGICLESLIEDLKDSGINYKVIVLDNNSQDNLTELEQKFSSGRIEFRYSAKNLGFGGGHNYISKMEESRHILILNSDIKFIEKDSIKRLRDKLIDNDAYKVSGPKLVEEDFRQQRFDHGELEGMFSRIKNNYGSSYWKPRKNPAEAAWVSGAVLLIEYELFSRVGGFDENFFLYKEEEDLCKRIRESGDKILYDPTVSVMHFGHVVARRSEHFSESMEYYLNKHFKNKLSYRLIHAVKVLKDIALYQKIRKRE